MFKRTVVVGLLLAVVSLTGVAAAQSTVKIGAAFPLTGSLATTGQDLKTAVEVAMDIINNAHPELSALTLAASEGLPNLGGAKVEFVFVDTQGDPSTGQNQVLRLITREQIAAVIGAYQSSVTKTTSAVAERYGVPYLNGASVQEDLTERGFQWFFRTTPVASTFAQTYFEFLRDIREQGITVETVAIVYENTDYGTSVAREIRSRAQALGYDIVADIPYNANTTDVTSQVTLLRQADPDVAFFISYTSDAILYINTMRNLNYRPRMIIGDNSGFTDPSFRMNVAEYAQELINRSEWVVGPEGSVSYLVNQMYRTRTGYDLDGSSSRVLQAALIIADAINRAGSTDPQAIRQALRETNLSPEQIIMPWPGVRFDETGQNMEARVVLQQLKGDDYVTIWPAANAEAELEWPYKGWQ